VIALGTGMLAGVLPAWTAMRLNVVSALRRI
jgi:ABC-type lipoprotein release transport system permease subunit